jgi:hypothetical protein
MFLAILHLVAYHDHQVVIENISHRPYLAFLHSAHVTCRGYVHMELYPVAFLRD